MNPSLRLFIVLCIYNFGCELALWTRANVYQGMAKNFVLINNVTFCCFFFFLTINKCVLFVAGKEVDKVFENSIPA
jgi:hypothetical protein